MPTFLGQPLGRYHILEQLGEGGMAYNDGCAECNGLIRSTLRAPIRCSQQCAMTDQNDCTDTGYN